MRGSHYIDKIKLNRWLNVRKTTLEHLNKLLKNKINVKITVKPEVTVQNIDASGSVGMDLNLNSLAMKLENTEYEPEQFPGLVYKVNVKDKLGKVFKATFLLFTNGKVVCTGTKSEDNVHRALDKLIINLKKLS